MTVEETINGLRSMIQSKKFIEHDFNGVVDEDVCEHAIELLKEQEAIEPYLDVDEWKCGNCGHDLEQEMLDGNVLFHEQYNYCPNCGKAVKWDD